MSTRVGSRLAGLVAGVVGVLALAGCGKEPTPVAQVPPPTPPTEPVLPPPPTTPVAPPTTPAGGGLPAGIDPVVRPTLPGQPNPMPGGFVPPNSPTFTPPDSLPGGQLPGTPVPPANPDPGPAKPAAPPGPGGTPPEPPKPTDPPADPPDPSKTPPPPTYPKEVGGKDLKGWLKELEYGGAGPKQKDDQVRETAVKVIPAFGPDARKPAVEPLIDAIRQDPDPGVQIAAITVVSNMGFDMREQVRPVIAVLQNKLGTSSSGNIVRMYCVRSLASFGADAAASIPYFRAACLDPSWETRREIAVALALVGSVPVDKNGKPKKDTGPDEKAIETLMKFQLQDRSVVVRLEAAKSLLALGPPFVKNAADFAKHTQEYQKVIEEVVKFEGGKGKKTNERFAAPDRSVYVWALLLQIMYDDRKIPDNLLELARLVKEPDGPSADQVRLFALQAIGAAGQLVARVERPTAEKVVGAVTEALRYDHQPMLVYTAMNTLALIGNEARDAVPPLEKIAADKPKPPAEGSPKGTPPDDSMQRMAKQTIEVITGKRKIEDYGKEDPKPAKKEPEKK